MSTVKRSLILAGGGLKVAFQAGVLQVWLDEAGLTFDHADGASGGTFNLAMYCQGMSGAQIADAWRRTKPVHGADIDIGRLARRDALLSMDRYRSDIFPTWGLDWDAIRASTKEATFNVCNFNRYELQVRTPDQMSEDMLVACVSLPMWFPPVEIDGETYVDAVYLSDANLEEAIRRGADEIWVIWTVSEEGTWRPGFVNTYFQIIEIAANGRFRQLVTRIQDNNAAIAAGHNGEFGRRIELKVLRSEVPVNYILDISADRLHEAVNLGVQVAREWCAAAGIPLTGRPQAPPAAEPSTLSFTEDMRGFVMPGEVDFEDGFRRARKEGVRLSVHLTITVDNVDAFVTSPQHAARITGHVSSDTLGDELPVEEGTFQLFVDRGQPGRKEMRYRLHFQDRDGAPFTLVGTKVVADDTGADTWSDTTTLYTSILPGRVAPGEDDNADVAAAGIVSIHRLDFLRQLTTFRVGGPVAARPAALTRFGNLFLGKLWDVYARRILPWGP